MRWKGSRPKFSCACPECRRLRISFPGACEQCFRLFHIFWWSVVATSGDVSSSVDACRAVTKLEWLGLHWKGLAEAGLDAEEGDLAKYLLPLLSDMYALKADCLLQETPPKKFPSAPPHDHHKMLRAGTISEKHIIHCLRLAYQLDPGACFLGFVVVLCWL